MITKVITNIFVIRLDMFFLRKKLKSNNIAVININDGDEIPIFHTISVISFQVLVLK